MPMPPPQYNPNEIANNNNNTSDNAAAAGNTTASSSSSEPPAYTSISENGQGAQLSPPPPPPPPAASGATGPESNTKTLKSESSGTIVSAIIVRNRHESGGAKFKDKMIVETAAVNMTTLDMKDGGDDDTDNLTLSKSLNAEIDLHNEQQTSEKNTDKKAE